eukprot:scaffold180130_cov31-Tisochrysis_lutea.AAC.1
MLHVATQPQHHNQPATATGNRRLRRGRIHLWREARLEEARVERRAQLPPELEAGGRAQASGDGEREGVV